LSLSELFLTHSIRKLDQMTAIIETCLSRLSQDQIWAHSGTHENAVGNLVLHLCGNVSQWIGHTVAGEPDIRNRPAEFATSGIEREALLALLGRTVSRATEILRALPEHRLSETVVAQDGERSVLDVIYQVVGHFQQHTGQIIFATKQFTGQDLAIYKG
jgi:hypothetical protein